MHVNIGSSFYLLFPIHIFALFLLFSIVFRKKGNIPDMYLKPFLQVSHVYTGANGLLQGGNHLRPWLLIDSSTVDPQTSRKLSARISKCALKEKKGFHFIKQNHYTKICFLDIEIIYKMLLKLATAIFVMKCWLTFLVAKYSRSLLMFNLIFITYCCCFGVWLVGPL